MCTSYRALHSSDSAFILQKGYKALVMSGVSEVANELFHYLASHESGCSDDELKQHFGDRYGGLASGINELLSINRLQLFQQGGALVYKAIQESTAKKFEGLA